jgi:hypothetical protein
MNRLPAYVIVLALLSGCPGVRMVPLRDLTLRASAPLDAPLRTGRRILIMPFSDERGDTYARATPTSHMPVVSLFHSGEHYFYPEQAGALRSQQDGRGAVASGALDSAMPDLIAGMMRRMNLSPHVFTVTDGGTYDYMLRGRLRTSRYTIHTSVITGVLLGLLGVPCYFTNYQLEYEVELFTAADQAHPVMKQTYRWGGSRTGGLYYNSPTAHPLFTRSLEDTLPQTVRDVAVALATSGTPPASPLSNDHAAP